MTATTNSNELKTVSAAGAQAVIAAGTAKAGELGVAGVIAVVDAAGTLKALLRMDGSALIAVDLASRKAYTAVALGGAPTGKTFEFVSQVPALLAALPSQPGVTLVGGGVPLFDGAVLLGAVGVSGGTVDQDVAIAEAAAAAVQG
ncbi:heme-binding protein [Streptomyces sp. NBC_01622]|uniref:GlcG/HbpS family heme-binding protein n=1 Tax=Streptomyces sp. NBC_01622 TaxID=2975903 RepID=UPI00386A2089|nr:heme-binding protein [Streptomyces sp. NBC_01622]